VQNQESCIEDQGNLNVKLNELENSLMYNLGGNSVTKILDKNTNVDIELLDVVMLFNPST